MMQDEARALLANISACSIAGTNAY